MDTPASEILVPLIVFATIFGIVYLAVSSRHRQRMAMIDKGITPSHMKEREEPLRSLKYGLLGIGVGIGLLLGYIFQTYAMVDADDNPLPYFIMVAICGGGALIIHHNIARKQNTKDQHSGQTTEG